MAIVPDSGLSVVRLEYAQSLCYKRLEEKTDKAAMIKDVLNRMWTDYYMSSDLFPMRLGGRYAGDMNRGARVAKSTRR